MKIKGATPVQRLWPKIKVKFEKQLRHWDKRLSTVSLSSLQNEHKDEVFK